MAIDQTDIAGRLDNALHWLDQNDIADLDVAQISAAAGRLTRKLAVYPTIFTNAAGEQTTVYDFWRAYCARVAEVEAAHQAALAGLAARADQQHAWVMAGDPRGTYGEP